MHDKPGASVSGSDPAVMQVDGAAGDSQPQPDAAAGPAAVAFDPEERLENRSEQVVRHAGPTIAHADRRHVSDQFQADLDRGLLRGVADGVAQHVLDGPPQELWLAMHGAGLRS